MIAIAVGSEGWPPSLLEALWFSGGWSTAADGCECIYVFGLPI